MFLLCCSVGVKGCCVPGTGKTTTLIRYAQQRPHLHFLYMTFKMSVATQAQRCFPSNVDCRTVHSMAFGAVCLSVGIDQFLSVCLEQFCSICLVVVSLSVKPFNQFNQSSSWSCLGPFPFSPSYQELKKLSSNVKPFSVAWVLPKGSGGFVNAKVVTLTLNAYMASANTHITPNHIPNTYKNTHGTVTVPNRNAKRLSVIPKSTNTSPPKETFNTHQKTQTSLFSSHIHTNRSHIRRSFPQLNKLAFIFQMFARDAQRIWDKMVALEETREYAHHMTHDGKPKNDLFAFFTP